jgi:hypothetical protein
MSNGHIIKSIHNNQSNPSINSLSTFFSTLTSSFRPYTPLKYYKKLRNGVINHRENHSIYHQLTVHTTNDENNNKTENENNQNSTIIYLPPSESDDHLIPDDNDKSTLTREHFFWLFIVTIIYFTWFIFIAGISIVHFLIYSALISLYLLSDRTRRLALAILIYLTYLFLYDTLHLVPNYSISKVHIRDVYLIERKFFGIVRNGQLMTLNEYFRLNHIPLLDVITGLCYLTW